MMTAAEIEKNTILGNHTPVKEALETLRAEVERLAGVPAYYSGTGKIRVSLAPTADRGPSANWRAIWAAARKVRNGLSVADYKVSSPTRGATHGGTFTLICDSFLVEVR